MKRAPVGKMLLAHLDGRSFRSLAEEYEISPATAYRYCLEALKELPHCADVTREYCSKFSQILLVDGKFLSVRGYERKIPVIYGVDYTTHDIPTYIFATSESYQACKKLFTSLQPFFEKNVTVLKRCNYTSKQGGKLFLEGSLSFIGCCIDFFLCFYATILPNELQNIYIIRTSSYAPLKEGFFCVLS